MDRSRSRENLESLKREIDNPLKWESLSELHIRTQTALFLGSPVLGVYSQESFYAHLIRHPIDGIDMALVPRVDRGVDHIVWLGGKRVALSQTKGYQDGKNCAQEVAKRMRADIARFEMAGFEVVTAIIYSFSGSFTRHYWDEASLDERIVSIGKDEIIDIDIPAHFDQVLRRVRDLTGRFGMSHRSFEPHEHQKNALEAAVRYWEEDGDDCTAVLACGTGKCFLGSMAIMSRTKNGGYAIFGTPTRSLAAQAGREIKRHIGTQCVVAYINHDRRMGKEDDITSDEFRSLIGGAPVFTRDEGEKVAKFERTIRKRNAESIARGGEPLVLVFVVVYDSAEAIAEAQKLHGMPEADIAVGDEAHRLVNSVSYPSGGGRSTFVFGVSARKRLYLTATPVSSHGAVDGKKPVLGDGKVFGEVVFNYTYRNAVDDSMLTDLSFVFLLADAPVAKIGMGGEHFFPVEGVTDDDGNELLVSEGAYLSIESVKMLSGIGANVSLVYERDVDSAEATARAIERKTGIRARAVHSDLPLPEIERRLAYAKTREAREKGYVIVNVRMVAEGIDIPSLDAVIYAHPINSEVLAMQSAMRPGRLYEGKERAYIVFPHALHSSAVEGRSARDGLTSLSIDNPRFSSLVNCALALLDGESTQSILGSIHVVGTGDSATPICPGGTDIWGGGKPHLVPDSADILGKIRALLARELRLHVVAGVEGKPDFVSLVRDRVLQVLGDSPDILDRMETDSLTEEERRIVEDCIAAEVAESALAVA